MPPTPAESASESNPLNSGGEIDYKSLFEKTSQEVESTKADLGRTRSEMEEIRSQSKQANSKFDRITKALTGGDDVQVDPLQSSISELQNEIKEHLEIAAKSEREGKGMPVTINNAIKRIEFQIETLKENAALKAQMAEIAGKVKSLGDPSATIDNVAFSNMDSHIISALETMYGPSDQYTGTKAAQFQAVSRLIVDEIQDLKKNEPQVWDRIRRDKNAQTKMVNHFIEKQIPPRARQIMEDDKIKREPMSPQETLSAYREAVELAKSNPKAKKHIAPLREQLLSQIAEKSTGKRGLINQLIRSGK